VGTDDTTTTVAEAPPGAATGWDTPIWDEFADRWARIVRGDDGDAEGGAPVAGAKPKRPVKPKKK